MLTGCKIIAMLTGCKVIACVADLLEYVYMYVRAPCVCGPRDVKIILGPGPLWSPQGSVLGLLLYIIYTSDIPSLLASQAMLGQLYADDVQAYQHCPASDALVTVSATSRTMEALGSWMSSSRLRLNPHQMQFISWLN